MFIWIVEEKLDLGCEQFAWEFVDAGTTEIDADEIILKIAATKKGSWRKRMVLLKDFAKQALHV